MVGLSVTVCIMPLFIDRLQVAKRKLRFDEAHPVDQGVDGG